MASADEATVLLCTACDESFGGGEEALWLERVTVSMTINRPDYADSYEIHVCAHVLGEAIALSGIPEDRADEWYPPANYIVAMLEGAEDGGGG